LNAEDVELIERSALDLPVEKLAVLNDGNSDRLVQFDLQPGLPVDLTYRLSGTATCEELIVTADARELSEKQLPRVEVLVSTLSAQCGFQTVRSLALKATNQPQQLELPASAAGWVIIRIVTPAERATLSIAEIELRGHTGPPLSRYAFKEAPAKAFSVLSEVQESVHVTVSDDEASLYRDAADGKLDDWSFAEAALLSSGIADAAERRKYLKQIDRIAMRAVAAVASAKTPNEKGERLLRWLHQNVMRSGYEANQTDLARVLASGKFNCVSSATLYNIVGRRLGLDLRGIEVPDHAFSILYVGSKHVDVETTNSHGFNPARDPRILERFKEQTGFHYIPDRHADKRREVTDTGLLALTCYNHGVLHSEEKQYALALADYFRALSLDPEFPSAIQNALSVFANWSNELSENAEHERAVRVVTTGLRLAPEDQNLLHNRKAIWQRWALAEIEGNRRTAAIDVLTQAAEQVPDGGFDRMQAYVFIHPGEKLAEDEQWEDALKLAGNGLEVVIEAAQGELRDWRNGVYHRWSNTALDKADYATAADVLERAMQAAPEEHRFSGNTVYVVQEWLRNTYESDGLADAEALMIKLAVRFEDIEDTQRVVEQFASRATLRLTETGGIDDALAFVDRNSDLLQEDVTGDLRRAIFDGRAKTLTNMQKWDEAIAVYTRGLKVLPEDSHLRNNLLAIWDMWASGFRRSGDWSKAADIYAKALDSGIDNGVFADKIGYCVQESLRHTYGSEGLADAEALMTDLAARFKKVEGTQQVIERFACVTTETLTKDRGSDDALAFVARNARLLPEGATKDLRRAIFDRQAAMLADSQKWDEAIAAYTRGLKVLPDDGHLRNNLLATWDSWAGQFRRSDDWSGAADIYARAFDSGIDNSTFAGKIGYCVQELALRTLEADGPEAAEKRIRAWQKKRPDVSELSNSAVIYVQTLIQQHQKDGEHQQALAAVDRCRPLLEKTDHERLICIACDTWSRTHVQNEEWKKAIDVYSRGLKSLPDDDHLTGNAVATWNRWAATHIDQKKWEDAIKVYEQALEYFPDDGTLQNNLEYCQQQAGK